VDEALAMAKENVDARKDMDAFKTVWHYVYDQD